MKRVNLEGQIFSGITALSFLRVVKQGAGEVHGARWLCRCHCGKLFEARGGKLKSGDIKSCGCIAGGLSHGHARRGSMSHEYHSWRAMIQRCTNPANNRFRYYGARGITVCEQWTVFENFLRDMGAKPTPKHSIERVKNDQGYSPDNCKWATALEQRHNRRDSIPA